MRAFIAAVAATVAFATPASATNVFFDNFDNEAGGSTVTNYSSFANFDVEGGSVDILRQPNGFGLTCAGGNGSSCVDLDGSTQDGGILVMKNAFTFNAGDLVKLSFDVSGSQRVTAEDFIFGFRSQTGAFNFNDVFINSVFYGNPNFGDFLTTNLNGTAFGLPAATPYGNFTLAFTAGAAGSMKAYVGSNSADNIGVIVDNFSIDVSAVPEPATWAMMIVGFGFVGGAMRRRKPMAHALHA